MFHGENGSFIVSDNIVKHSGNFNGIFEASLSTVTNGDGEFDVTGTVTGVQLVALTNSVQKRVIDLYLGGL